MIFKRNDTDQPIPGTWRPCSNPSSKKMFKGEVCCPKCKFRASIGRTHEVAGDGTVTPSMVCPHDGCDFHEFIKLEGWQ